MIAATAVWCAGTLGGAAELLRGNWEDGLTVTALAALLGGVVGSWWAKSWGRQNEVPEFQRDLLAIAGGTAAAGSTVLVGLGAVGIAPLLPPAPDGSAERP